MSDRTRSNSSFPKPGMISVSRTRSDRQEYIEYCIDRIEANKKILQEEMSCNVKNEKKIKNAKEGILNSTQSIHNELFMIAKKGGILDEKVVLSVISAINKDMEKGDYKAAKNRVATFAPVNSPILAAMQNQRG
jgi:hypothetical protein